MAKAFKKTVKKAEWKGYHKVNLSKEDGILFESWKETNPIELDHLGILANNGYKFSLGWDDYHQGISASLYCTQQKMDWAGWTLTAWAADPETAIQLLFYKHYVMCGEVWEVAPERSENQGASYG